MKQEPFDALGEAVEFLTSIGLTGCRTLARPDQIEVQFKVRKANGGLDLIDVVLSEAAEDSPTLWCWRQLLDDKVQPLEYLDQIAYDVQLYRHQVDSRCWPETPEQWAVHPDELGVDVFEVTFTWADDPENNNQRYHDRYELIYRFPWVAGLIGDKDDYFSLVLVQDLCRITINRQSR